MEYLQAIIYGIVQGLTEFLPVSSTAHIAILSNIFGNKAEIAFDVALHIGTAIAVLAFFFKDWVKLVTAGFSKPKSNDGKLFWWIVWACVPAGIIALIAEKYLEETRNLYLISTTLIILGIVLYYIDKIGKKTISTYEIGAKNSFLIGLSQCVALIPGVSRSGITITTGRALGIKREDVARFTFLLSTPTIAGAGLYKIKDIIDAQIGTGPLITAIVTSAIVGALCIKFLMEYIKKRGFGVFAIYRIALGVILIILTSCNILSA